MNDEASPADLRPATTTYTVRAPFRFPTTYAVTAENDPFGSPRCPQLGPEGARCERATSHEGVHQASTRVAGNLWTHEWASCDHGGVDPEPCTRHGVPDGVDEASEDAIQHALGRAHYECLRIAGQASLTDLDAIVSRAVEVVAPLLIAEGRRRCRE